MVDIFDVIFGILNSINQNSIYIQFINLLFISPKNICTLYYVYKYIYKYIIIDRNQFL